MILRVTRTFGRIRQTLEKDWIAISRSSYPNANSTAPGSGTLFGPQAQTLISVARDRRDVNAVADERNDSGVTWGINLSCFNLPFYQPIEWKRFGGMDTTGLFFTTIPGTLSVMFPVSFSGEVTKSSSNSNFYQIINKTKEIVLLISAVKMETVSVSNSMLLAAGWSWSRHQTKLL